MVGTTSGVRVTPDGTDVHLTIFAGKTLRFAIIWGGFEPIDITGWTAKLQVRNKKSQLIFSLSTDDGSIVNEGGTGRIWLNATPEQTSLLKESGRYELELTDSIGNVFRALSGFVSVEVDVVQ